MLIDTRSALDTRLPALLIYRDADGHEHTMPLSLRDLTVIRNSMLNEHENNLDNIFDDMGQLATLTSDRAANKCRARLKITADRDAVLSEILRMFNRIIESLQS